MMEAYGGRRPEIRLLMATALAALTVAAAALFSACGGQEGQGPTATPAPAGTTGASTPGAGLPMPTPPPVDSGVPLVEFHSADKGYSLGYPEGWQPDASPGPTDSFLWSIGERDVARLQVTCNPERLSAKSLMLADAAVAAQYGAGIDPANAMPVQVGGVDGERNTYSISVGGLRIEHVVAYVVHGRCGYRIGLNSFGSGSLDPYLPLFDRILASVRFD